MILAELLGGADAYTSLGEVAATDVSFDAPDATPAAVSFFFSGLVLSGVASAGATIEFDC